jgi:hypothetical protein
MAGDDELQVVCELLGGMKDLTDATGPAITKLNVTLNRALEDPSALGKLLGYVPASLYSYCKGPQSVPPSVLEYR